jgi:hypothetical protein
MGDRIWTAARSVAVLALVAGPSAAWAELPATKPADIRATHAYLLAAHQLAQTTEGPLPLEKAALHALVGQGSSQCPNVLAGAPRDKATEAVRAEALGVAALAAYRQRRAAVIAFDKNVQLCAGAIASSPTSSIAPSGESLARAAIVPPDICADAQTVAASRCGRRWLTRRSPPLRCLTRIPKIGLVDRVCGEA